MTRVKFNQPARPFFHLLDDWFQEFPARTSRELTNGINTVPVNILETSDGYHLELNAPGRTKEEFKIQVENGLLTISYEQKENQVQEGLKQIRREFTQHSFKRSFTLDDKIDENGIQAKYEQGLLKLYLPKKEIVANQPKQISIL
ncbi:MAG: Hsp20/alpha crystallin family protein [Flavipsychrobacter sp.]|jgi:HSP20 family protein|nr:Hsp20/alpha crystallin family protein [Flavipsychrobacter sp.]